MSLKNDWPQITLCPPPERLIQRKLHGRLDICWIARRELLDHVGHVRQRHAATEAEQVARVRGADVRVPAWQTQRALGRVGGGKQ